MVDTKESIGSMFNLIVGVGIAVLVLIFMGVFGGQTYNLIEEDLNSIGNNVIVGEGFLADNSTETSLDHSFIQEGTLVIVNDSAGKPFEVSNTNFTIDYNAGRLQLNPSSPYLNATDMNANYTWGAKEVRTSVQDGIVSSFDALKQTGDYLPIVVLALIIAFVLVLVLGFTTLGGKQSGGNTAL